MRPVREGVGAWVWLSAGLVVALAVIAGVAPAPSSAQAAAVSAPVVVSDPAVASHLAAFDGERVLLEEEIGGRAPEIVLYRIADGARLRLTDNSYRDDNAAFDGRHVVWEGHVDGSNPEIFLLDTEGGPALRLTDNTDEDLDPQVAGDLVAWGRRGGTGAQVVLYDIDTAEERTLSGFLFDPESIRVGGGWVVWQGVEDGGTVVLAYSTATGETTRLSPSGNTGALGPSISGSLVAWVELVSDGGYRVWAADLDSGTTWALGDLWGGEPTITVAGDSVLVAEDDSFEGRLTLFRRSVMGFDGGRRLSSLPAGGAGDPSLAGALAVWRASDYHDDEIVLFDLDADRRVQVTNDPWTDRHPLVAEGRLVWEGYGAGRAQVYLADVGVLPESPYADVPLSHPAYSAVIALTEQGVVGGYESGGLREFHPDATLFRAQMAKIMVEALGLRVDEGMVVGFSDLGPDEPDSLYPHEYVAAAVAAGMFTGKSPSRFAPFEPVTRGQALSVVVRATERYRPGVLDELPPGHWSLSGDYPSPHTQNIDLAKYNGLLGGVLTGDALWNPWEPFSRGAVAQVVWNYLGLRAPAGRTDYMTIGLASPPFSSLAQLEAYVAERQALLQDLAVMAPHLPVAAEVVLRHPLTAAELSHLWETYAFGIDFMMINGPHGSVGTGGRSGESADAVVERLVGYGDNVEFGTVGSLQVVAPAATLLRLAGEQGVLGVAPGPVEEFVPLVRAGKQVAMTASGDLSGRYRSLGGGP